MNFSGFYFDNNSGDEFRSRQTNYVSSHQHVPKIKSPNKNIYLNQPSFSYYSEKLNFYKEDMIKHNEEFTNTKKDDEECLSISSYTNTSEISFEDETRSSSSLSKSSPDMKVSFSKNDEQINSKVKLNLDSERAATIKQIDQFKTSSILTSRDINLQTKTENKSFDIPFDYGVVSGLFFDEPKSSNTTIFAVTLDENRRKKTQKYISSQMITTPECLESGLRSLTEFDRNNKRDIQIKQLIQLDHNKLNKNTKFDYTIANKLDSNYVKLNEYNEISKPKKFPIKTMESIYFSKKVPSQKVPFEKHVSNAKQVPDITVLELKDEKIIIDYLKSCVDNKLKKDDGQKIKISQYDTDKMIDMCAIMLDTASYLGQIEELLSKIKRSLK